MMWKAIGSSVTGTSHTTTGRQCEDAVAYKVVSHVGSDALICCVSDGAGSAQYAALASSYTVSTVTDCLAVLAASGSTITEGDIYTIIEQVYDGLADQATQQDVDISEFSCTLLGCYLTDHITAFFRIGDGAIIRSDGNGYYTPVWWPFNGEYHNTTSFIIDDKALSNLSIMILEEPVSEVSILSDGLQMLALNMETRSAHQPFFTDLFRHLRMAGDADKIAILNSKLAEYLESPRINERTDDDKTLFLATRLAP